MKFKELFIKDTLEPDWERIASVPEFAALKETQQNSDFHKEGNVWTHTRLVTEAMSDLINKEPYLDIYIDKIGDLPEAGIETAKLILMSAALCHDLGKAGHTAWDENDRQWHCENHGRHGEKVVRRLFHDENPLIREAVCDLTRHHMALHYISQSDGAESKLRKLARLSWSNAPLHYYLLLLLADCIGAHCDDNSPANNVKRIDKIREIADGCEVSMFDTYKSDDKPFAKYGKYELFKPEKDKVAFDRSIAEDERKTLVMMVGLPGAGKNSYIDEYFRHEHAVVLSRDDIRRELGFNPYAGTDRKIENRVSGIFNKRLSDAFDSGKETIVVNNTNLQRKWRDPIVIEALRRGYRTEAIVIETPGYGDYAKRRKSEMGKRAESVIDGMYDNYEFPSIHEFDSVAIVKQTDETDPVTGLNLTTTHQTTAYNPCSNR